MSNVAVEKHKLDVLATAISNKSGVPLTLTLTEMVDAVDSIQTGGGGGQPSLQTKSATYTPTTSQQTATITADSGYDGLEEVDITVNPIPSNYVDTSDANATQNSLLEGATAYVNGAKITGVIPQMTQYTGDITQYFHTENNQRKWSFEGIIRTDYGGMVNPGASFGTGQYTYNAVPANTVITPTSQAQTVGGANWMMEGPITINPASGGASNFFTGTFTTPSTTSTNGTVTVSYTGTGYPIALIVFVEGGCYNAAVSGWYNSMVRYAVGQYCITKSDTTLTPTYGTSGGANLGTVQLLYKNSTTNANSYSSTRSIGANSYSSSNANGTSTTCVRWTSNTLLSYRTSGGTSSTYGLLADTTYRYIAVYSQ